MDDPKKLLQPPKPDLSGWDFAGARRHHLEMGLRMSPAERLQWLEETVEEMRGLQGLAKGQAIRGG
ncbi:MAG: hypothetical protein ABJC13_23165 [Acidobacteriota bacterium]